MKFPLFLKRDGPLQGRSGIKKVNLLAPTLEKMKKDGIAAFVVFLAFSATLFGFGVDVQPTVNQITVPAGGSYAGQVQIKNTSDKPITVNSSVMDWIYESPTGAKKFFPVGKSKFSLSPYLTYSPSTFSLEPGQSREVHYQVSIPANASGGYYSLILFGGGSAKANKGSNSVVINLNLQMASLFLVEVDKSRNVKGSVGDLKILNSKLGQALEVEARFKNEGNVRINAQGKLSIMDAKGNMVGWTKFPELKTLPGDEWPVTASWGGLGKGQYRIVATFELAPGILLIKEKDVTVQ